ncbi:glutamyl-tRNA amidotransferase [Sulfodiicoccus acidiphilus]|uniref:Aspartyl/glutamyl-tRNA(Asn/Gln) amidotransferase subunit B n=1 Tax=Sulfodiicoccus acidiphilus TaxID=1670455 RepID=A0A348B0D9_9CREN|nr:Asp-tRNA(Asn)/Glu-tRNA(Gln) amidotransferase subunit GatB [Sulfodiicoccus acidiphilus]BBD71641.1 glutamyl-tRNA amidotransferase [Sulfodiicoccus acidiphilus]GGT86911.1 glutamyl-tRNA amidotransferase [Sulfodiicoccus acidiphilus]
MVLVGLEVHAHLTALRTKLFCPCPSDYVGKQPNSNVCPICLGLPGAIPVFNERALRLAIMVGIALGSRISNKVTFVRKHYFYPDMSKNYQISQYDGPGTEAIAMGGQLRIRNKNVRIRRINIEEDPAKSVYPTGSMLTSQYTLLDYNRSGMGMLEIVTEPDMSEPRETREFLEKLRSVLEHLGVCDGSIEGAIRADANVSVEGGERVEVKNIGSAKDVELAVAYEISRQRAAVSQGIPVKRETRHWDAERRVTVPLRSKETEEDYRYFPDPDLPPISVNPTLIEEIRKSMPELPDQRIERFIKQYGISSYNANVLVMNKQLADFFEKVAEQYHDYTKASSLIINDYLRWLNERDLSIAQAKAGPRELAELLKMLDEGIITIKIAKEFLPRMIYEGKAPKELVEATSMTALRDRETLEAVVDSVIKENPKAVKEAKREPKAIHYLVGQVMKKTSKRAEPETVYKLLEKRIKETSM